MKNIIIGITIGGMIFGTVGVIAATTISSKNVTYQNKTVNTALDELYNEAITGKELVAAAITNKGVATTVSDSYETMATNINSIDTDHTEFNQKISNLESKHNNDVSTITGSISRINQNLSTEWKNLFTPSSNGFYGRYAKVGNLVTVQIYALSNATQTTSYFDIGLTLPVGYRPKLPFFATYYDDLHLITEILLVDTAGRIQPKSRYVGNFDIMTTFTFLTD